MRLKKLVINGFKSFGTKTEIEFDENLIGIVGPNGSGKSNVIDAIKWVLGQQKMSELRTKSNVDVIFSGSEGKSPKNVAEVTVVFDNQSGYLDIEYAEVAITRRLFRTGDNEYYINKNKCRLIDINNLILDKGFGKDSFSIISQGKVDEIIMSKPDSRRAIIDEVAGISKYKSKKKITLNKLAIVNENLNRINFILEEITSRIEPLALEREKAIRYKKVKAELEQREKTLFANKIFENKNNLDSLRDNLIKIKKELEVTNKTIEEMDNFVKNLDEIISQNQISINYLNEKITSLNNRKFSYSNEIDLISRKKELQGEDNQEILISGIREKLNKLQKEESDVKYKKLEAEPLKESLAERMAKLREEIYIITSNINNLQNNLYDIERQDKDNKIPYYIQKVLDLKRKEVLGTVKQNMEVYSKYGIAIKSILGNRQNEIIVSDDKVISELIKYLKDNKLGKATFSPINKVRPRFIDNNSLDLIKNSKIELKSAMDCIKFDSKLKNVMSSLFGNIVIANNVIEAQEANKFLGGKYQIVTLDGDVLAISGKVTGGYDKRHLITDLRVKKDDLKIKISESIKEKESLNNELEKLNFDYSEYKIQLDLIENRLEDILVEKKALEIEYNSLVDSSSNPDESNIYNLEEEIKDIDSAILKFSKEKMEKEEEIKNSIEKKEVNSQKMLDIRANFKMFIKDETEMKIKIETLEIEIKELIDNLREKYNVSFQKAYEESIKLDNILEYELKIKKLKNEVKEIGFVNLDAIEEYEIQKERLDFYSENEKDLKVSKEKINDVIKKIDNFVITVFKETFDKLNLEFKIVFEQLFDGGTAMLKLTDEEDLLNTGVEIIAQPPGKKTQIIGLLSGGEKALTAISLLFAILKIRIVPFAILDEVEAALDEANVVKYIDYLKVFSEKTQFILITHRQTTMEKIDKLYGITMIEKGISSVLDINLKEMEKESNV